MAFFEGEHLLKCCEGEVARLGNRWNVGSEEERGIKHKAQTMKLFGRKEGEALRRAGGSGKLWTLVSWAY